MAHTEISTPDTDHVSKKDIISIRLKHNRYTGARYETDQWLEARHNEDTGLYDVYHCEAKWTHSKSTRRFNNQYQGQSNTCVVPDMDEQDAHQLIQDANYHARELERKNRGERNPDGTKVYQAFYPAKQNFMRLITGQWGKPKKDLGLITVQPPEKEKFGKPVLVIEYKP